MTNNTARIDGAPGPTKAASLLGLPAELRNQIWRLVLVRIADIDINTEQDTLQPSLLRVSRQIRSETRDIYCQENCIFLNVHNLKFAPHSSYWVWNLGGNRNAFLSYHGWYSWKTLAAWAREHWEVGWIRPIELRETNDENSTIVAEIFTAVDALWESGAKWRGVEATLQSFRKILETTDDAALWIE